MGTSQGKPRYLVLGQQLAAAKKAEEQRVASGTAGVSPLSPDMRYGPCSGEQFFLDLVPLPLDAKLNDLCQRYAESGPSERSLIRSSLSLDDFYTLWTFSGRSAALALRENQPQRVAIGLTATAAIELDRIDFRDVSLALNKLYYVASKIGKNPEKHFRAAALLAEPKISDFILKFIESPARAKGLDSMCLATVQTKKGPSLIRREVSPYAPTLRMEAAAVDIAELIHSDKYCPEISLATMLPPVWLRSVDDNALGEVLRTVLAGANIRGTLRPGESPDARYQHFVIFLVEAAKLSDADTLSRLTEAKIACPGDIALLGINAGRLFCLVVARSATMGKKSYETRGSLARFSDGLHAILSKYQEV